MNLLTEKDLHGYQWTAIDHIINIPKSALFLDMGLGKTVSTLTAIKKLMFEELEISKVLIIAPKRVAESVWPAELSKWSHFSYMTISKVIGNEKQRLKALNDKADIYTIGRDNVVWLCAQYGGMKLPFDWVVIDESSSFKNHKAQKTRSLKKAITSVPRVTELTGTPAPNGYLDLWAQIQLLDQGERLETNITKYREKYFTKNFSGWGYDLRDGSAESINNKIKDIVISMKAEDYLDMPKALTEDVIIDFPKDMRDKYDKFEEESVLALIEDLELNGYTLDDLDSAITAMNAAGLRNKLLQFANGAVYDNTAERNVHHFHDLKLDALEDIVEAANGSPVLVGWCFQHDRDRILKKFPNAVQLKTDEHIQQWNRGEIQMLLMHPASGGHGLNLQFGGHFLVWFGCNDSLELYQQLNKRLDRQGQKFIVVIKRLLIRGTADSSIRRDHNLRTTLDREFVV